MEKESFLFHKVWKDIIGGLPGRVRAEVYEAIIEYGISGKLPQLRAQAQIAFDFVRKDIDRENEEQRRKAEVSERMRGVVMKRWRPKEDASVNTHVNTHVYTDVHTDVIRKQYGRNTDVYTEDSTKNLACVVNNNINIDDEYNITQTKETEEKKETPKGGKKEKSPVVSLEGKKSDFYSSLVPYVEKYGKETVRAFFDYWTEPNKSKTKMRYELERTWDVGRRLARWAANEKVTPRAKADIGVILKDNSPDKYNSPQEKKWEERWK